jgi:hypothetical protein
VADTTLQVTALVYISNYYLRCGKNDTIAVAVEEPLVKTVEYVCLDLLNFCFLIVNLFEIFLYALLEVV